MPHRRGGSVRWSDLYKQAVVAGSGELLGNYLKNSIAGETSTDSRNDDFTQEGRRGIRTTEAIHRVHLSPSHFSKTTVKYGIGRANALISSQ